MRAKNETQPEDEKGSPTPFGAIDSGGVFPLTNKLYA